MTTESTPTPDPLAADIEALSNLSGVPPEHPTLRAAAKLRRWKRERDATMPPIDASARLDRGDRALARPGDGRGVVMTPITDAFLLDLRQKLDANFEFLANAEAILAANKPIDPFLHARHIQQCREARALAQGLESKLEHLCVLLGRVPS